MKNLVLLVLLIISISEAKAQRYIIKFKDKNFSQFTLANPSAFLSQRAVERRQRFSISIDSTDLPVTARYIDSLKSVAGVQILNTSKWMNQVSILISDAGALDKINSFPFVVNTARIGSRIKTDDVKPSDKFETSKQANVAKTTNVASDFYTYGNAYAQMHIHNGEFLHNIGLRGQNMIVGLLDAGYFNYTTLPSFDSINKNGQVLGTWDFVTGNSSVSEDHSHGMNCLSIIAANIPGTFIGSAPKAAFYLFRTEDAATEYPIEEHNWVCGAERIDSAGGDVISSSLGYNLFDDPSFNYTYADLNGNTTMIARGADLAAKKGIVVVQAAGNEGAKAWKYISTPADADSVLTVGAVNAAGQVAAFSSYGPTADGQVKPDVASVGAGTIIQNANGSIGGGNGTSYACPNMAGLVTCLMQGFPEYSNMKIINTVRQAASAFATPNDRIGYGIPDMKKAVMTLLKDFASSSATITDCKTTLSWTSKDVAAMKYEIERKDVNDATYKKIGERFGTGNVFSTHSYQFTDTLKNTSGGLVSYRIKQVIDTTGASVTADYIDSASVELTLSCALKETVVVLPNPVREQFTLQVNTDQATDNLLIQVVNIQGQIVWSSKQSKTAGINNITIPSQRFAKGKYFVVVYQNNEQLDTKEIIKL